MSFSNEDVTVRRYQDVVRLPEVVRFARAAGLSQGHQQLAIGAELKDLMSLGGRRCGRRAVRWATHTGAGAVRHPDIPFVIDVDAMRRDEHPGAERRQQLPGRVELEDCRE